MAVANLMAETCIVGFHRTRGTAARSFLSFQIMVEVLVTRGIDQLNTRAFAIVAVPRARWLRLDDWWLWF